MPESNLQTETNKKDYERIKIPEEDVPDEVKRKLNTLPEGKYSDIVSKSANRHWQDKPNRVGHPN